MQPLHRWGAKSYKPSLLHRQPWQVRECCKKCRGCSGERGNKIGCSWGFSWLLQIWCIFTYSQPPYFKQKRITQQIIDVAVIFFKFVAALYGKASCFWSLDKEHSKRVCHEAIFDGFEGSNITVCWKRDQQIISLSNCWQSKQQIQTHKKEATQPNDNIKLCEEGKHFSPKTKSCTNFSSFTLGFSCLPCGYVATVRSREGKAKTCEGYHWCIDWKYKIEKKLTTKYIYKQLCNQFPNTAKKSKSMKNEDCWMNWTTYANLNQWFDGTKACLIRYGYVNNCLQCITDIFNTIQSPCSIPCEYICLL